MAREGCELAAGGDIPEARRTIVGCGDNPLAVRGEDRRDHRIGVADEAAYGLAGGGVPQRGSTIVVCGDNRLAVRTPRDRQIELADLVLAQAQAAVSRLLDGARQSRQILDLSALGAGR